MSVVKSAPNEQRIEVPHCILDTNAELIPQLMVYCDCMKEVLRLDISLEDRIVSISQDYC